MIAVKSIYNTLAALLFSLTLPASVLAQNTLILPHSADDIRALSKPVDTGPCPRCGVLTNVHTENRAPQKNRSQESTLPGANAGNVQTTPIIGSGTVVKDSRKANSQTTFYKMTVRFDDGTYAFFEQDEQPSLNKGDKVQIIDGRVEAPRQ